MLPPFGKFVEEILGCHLSLSKCARFFYFDVAPYILPVQDSIVMAKPGGNLESIKTGFGKVHRDTSAFVVGYA